MAAKFNGVYVINNITGLGKLFINENFSSKMARFLYKISQHRANRVFFQNEDELKLFLEHNFITQSIADRIPGSGVDLKRFTLSPSTDDGVVRFLFFARMLYDKGIGHYVEAARHLKLRYGNKVEFNLLGFLDNKNPSTVSETEMQAWCDEGIVNYLGVTDTVEVEIAKVDCMVLP